MARYVSTLTSFPSSLLTNMPSYTELLVSIKDQDLFYLIVFNMLFPWSGTLFLLKPLAISLASLIPDTTFQKVFAGLLDISASPIMYAHTS